MTASRRFEHPFEDYYMPEPNTDDEPPVDICPFCMDDPCECNEEEEE